MSFQKIQNIEKFNSKKKQHKNWMQKLLKTSGNKFLKKSIKKKQYKNDIMKKILLSRKIESFGYKIISCLLTKLLRSLKNV